jgi:hypothetical protein
MEAAHVQCVQALGSEIYIGCSNGELLRYALQADDPDKLESYKLLSRQSLPTEKPIDELVLIPCLYRVLVQSDRQVFFYTLPSLDPVSPSIMRPIRGVITFAVDEQHLERPIPPISAKGTIPASAGVDFCVVKRATLQLYTLRDRLEFLKEIPLPSGGNRAKRSGQALFIADKEFFNLILLEQASMLPLLPINQTDTPPTFDLRPQMVITGDSEFLLISWTGAGALGVFIKGDGDPCRGTLEWPSYPVSLSFHFPHITALLQNRSIEIHNIETQALVQVIPPPEDDKPMPQGLSACIGGYLVPSARSDKLQIKSVSLLRSRTEVTPAG